MIYLKWFISVANEVVNSAHTFCLLDQKPVEFLKRLVMSNQFSFKVQLPRQFTRIPSN